MGKSLHMTVVAVAAFGLAFTACSSDEDDGATVRNLNCDTASSASGSATAAAGSASGSATGSASGSAPCPEGSGGATCSYGGDIASADTRVSVRLDEWAIRVATRSAPAGTVGFVVKNAGEETHELVVVRGVSPRELPLDGDGALDEARLPEGALVGEVEGVPAGETCRGVFELTAGEYTLVCNITETEDGKTESHLHEGMVTTFTVT
jgi:hypothetical protein